MDSFLAPLKIGAATTISMLATAGVDLGQGNVSVAVAVSCCVFISGIVWWLSAKFQSLTDAQRDVSKRLSHIEDELGIKDRGNKD